MKNVAFSKNKTVHWLIMILALLLGLVVFFAYHLHVY